MKKKQAISIALTIALSISSSTAFAFYDWHNYSGKIGVDQYRTTSEERKYDMSMVAPSVAYFTVKTKDPQSYRTGHRMVKPSGSIASDTMLVPGLMVSAEWIEYIPKEGKKGSFYAHSVKNHAENSKPVTVSGTWKP